jgi:predicted amidohydrolase
VSYAGESFGGEIAGESLTFLQCEKDEEMWRNSCLTYDPSGELVHRYDKLHPCEAKFPDMDVSESKSCVSGEADQPGLELLEVKSQDGETWKFGVTICYDIRYPQLFTFLRAKGAEAFIISTAWFPTTRRHWDPLLTTRAIDNQAYAIAPAQVGSHHEERESLGASAVIDPWGDKVVRLPSIADRKDGQKKTNGEVKTNGTNGDVKKNGPNGVAETTDTSYAHNGNGKTHHAPAGDIEVGSDGEWEDLGNDEDGGPGVAIGYAVLRKEKVNELREMVPVWENLRTEVYGKPDGR